MTNRRLPILRGVGIVSPDLHGERHLPQCFAVGRIEADDRLRVPDDQLPLAAEFEDDGSAVAGLGAIECAPQFFAGLFVEAHDHRAGRAAGQHDELIAVDERRSGHAPRGHFRAEVGRQIFLPKDVAGGDVETKQVPHGAERVNTVAVDRRRGSRAERVADRVAGFVLVFPKLFAGFRIEAQHAL